MFKCQGCGFDSKPGEKQRRVVTQRREKTYSQRVLTKVVRDEAGDRFVDMVPTDVVQGYGWEIVAEIAIASCCVPKGGV